MEWRTANDLGELVDTAYGSWTVAELDELVANAAKVEKQLNRIKGAEQAVETKRAKAAPSACPECGAVFTTAQARGGHVTAVHRRSLRSA